MNLGIFKIFIRKNIQDNYISFQPVANPAASEFRRYRRNTHIPIVPEDANPGCPGRTYFAFYSIEKPRNNQLFLQFFSIIKRKIGSTWIAIPSHLQVRWV